MGGSWKTSLKIFLKLKTRRKSMLISFLIRIVSARISVVPILANIFIKFGLWDVSAVYGSIQPNIRLAVCHTLPIWEIFSFGKYFPFGKFFLPFPKWEIFPIWEIFIYFHLGNISQMGNIL